MSYILEALKKSQQERELGQVPTLDASGIFVEDKEPASPNYWAFLSVGLAVVAVMIALYAAFRDGPPQPSGGLESDGVPTQAPATTGQAGEPGVSAQAPSGSDDAAALIEPPPPKRARRTEAPPAPLVSEGGGAVSDDGPDIAVDGLLDTEAELLRQLQAEQDALSADPAVAKQPRPRAPRKTGPPPDLVKDIEAFKQQVRREQGMPPPKSQRKPAKLKGDPTKLKLTAQQQAMVPAFLMTVHVYDEEPAKRFVVINAMKYLEGDETREGLRVEQILKDGAVLSYVGNPFYVER